MLKREYNLNCLKRMYDKQENKLIKIKIYLAIKKLERKITRKPMSLEEMLLREL